MIPLGSLGCRAALLQTPAGGQRVTEPAIDILPPPFGPAAHAGSLVAKPQRTSATIYANAAKITQRLCPGSAARCRPDGELGR
jgi:hypothetical protein